MALTDAAGVPKSRPVPQQNHIDAGRHAEEYRQAVRIVMAQRNLPWPEAVKVVEREKVANILAKHNAPAPAPAVAEEKKAG